MDRIQRFLKKGYFPIQLPPGFSSEQFSKKYTMAQGTWNNISTRIDTRPEKFSVARSSYNRRVISIPNPYPYLILVKTISKYWEKIVKHYKKSKLSLSIPTLKGSDRAIFLTNFGDLHEFKLLKSAGYQYSLVTDISRFFPTIYTHTIPWALHGKEVAKRHRHPSNKYYGNKIDKDSMLQHDGQTFGIPIGPDTLHIIAEIIGVAIDIKFKELYGDWPTGFRYVDDFYLFFNKKEEAEEALARLTQAVNCFELQINSQKTKIIKVKDIIEDSWKIKIKKLKISPRIKQQREDIHNFFSQLSDLELIHKDESIYKYGLIVISTKIIKKQNWDIFEAFLYKIGFSYPNTIQIISQILCTYKKHGYEINRKNLERFCNSVICEHSISDNHSEIAWSLWLLKEFNLKLLKQSIDLLRSVSSSICMLLALDLQSQGLTEINFEQQFLKKYAVTDELYGPNWILSYEAGRRRWLGNSVRYISNDPIFGVLHSNTIGFYDQSVKSKPIFKLKKIKSVNRNIYGDDKFWESDWATEDELEYERISEEYFDTSTIDDEEEEEDVDQVEESDDSENDDNNDFFEGLF